VTSRQVAGRLHDLGHTVGVLSSESIGLTRFTAAVSAWHRVGPFGTRPLGWLEEAVDVVRRHDYDVLLPTQEQVTVLSWARSAGWLTELRTAVPSFDALRSVQDKVSAEATLAALAIPRPATEVLARTEDLRAWDRFPAYAKLPVATASTGVVRLDRHDDAVALADRWPDGPVVVQLAVDAPLAMVQSVWDDGRLVAFHANLRAREGVRGGASHKVGLSLPAARHAIERLGTALDWHGGLAADVLLGPDGPLVIDVNPRLVEPGSALAAGTDLTAALLGIASGSHPGTQPDGRPGAATHQLLLAVLGAAQHDGTRRAVARELWQAARRSGPYAGSTEELTPVAGDPRAALPLMVAAGATLIDPRNWSRFAGNSVSNYAISPTGWDELCELAPSALSGEPVGRP
jgi:hypothetical protein